MHIFHLLTTLILVLALNSQAASIEGRVVSVADGDTLTLLDQQHVQHKIRLQGIDAPEKAQAFGQKSKQSLHELVHSQTVLVEFEKKDKYGRTVGKVLLNNNDICLEQIKRGMAWHYKQYASEQPKEDRLAYAQAENAAREKSIGLWKDKAPTPPWEFRRQIK